MRELRRPLELRIADLGGEPGRQTDAQRSSLDGQRTERFVEEGSDFEIGLPRRARTLRESECGQGQEIRPPAPARGVGRAREGIPCGREPGDPNLGHREAQRELGRVLQVRRIQRGVRIEGAVVPAGGAFEVVESRRFLGCRARQRGRVRHIDEGSCLACVPRGLRQIHARSHVRLIEGPKDPRVQAPACAPGWDQRFVDRFSHQRVREAEMPANESIQEEPDPHDLFEAPVEGRPILDASGEQVPVHLHPDRRCTPQHVERPGRNLFQLRAQQVRDASRQQGLPFALVTGLPQELAGLEGSKALDQEKRVPARLSLERRNQSRIGRTAELPCDQRLDFGFAKAREWPALETSQAQDPFEGTGLLRTHRHVLLAAGRDDDDRKRAERSSQELEQAERLRVRGMQIVEHDRERTIACRSREKAEHRIEESNADRLLRARHHDVAGSVQLGNDPRDAGSLQRRQRFERARIGVDQLAEHPRPAPIGRTFRHEPPGCGHLRACRERPSGEQLGRSRLPDPGFAREEEHATVARESGDQSRPSSLQDLGAAHVVGIRIDGSRGLVLDLDGRHEAVAAARHRDDDGRISGRIPERPPREADDSRQRGHRDHRPGPEGREQLRLPDHALAMTREIDDEFENLGLDRNEMPIGTKLGTLRVEGMTTEREPHREPAPAMDAIANKPNPPIDAPHAG
ncbi:MAG: hypothetical protein U0900_15240 [Myxococcota bacterium]